MLGAPAGGRTGSGHHGVDSWWERPLTPRNSPRSIPLPSSRPPKGRRRWVNLAPMPGPLEGVRVLELAGIGPAPYTCMLLSQLGADVLRVDRPAGSRVGNPDLLADGRPTLTLDLKSAEDVGTLLRLAERADVLVEGFRPGVAERLGIGPDECLAANPRLVYARMTGWGQDGPLADKVGHDIN